MNHTPGPHLAVFDSMGGYDCITDAFNVINNEGRILATLDLKHYGHNESGQGADIAAIREAGRAEAFANARLFAAAAGLVKALQQIAAYPVNVDGYNSPGAVKLRFAAVQVIARETLAKLIPESNPS